VAILGGGMAGLAAAWRLSSPEHRDRFDTITVYQRGDRLGGKGASHRGVNGRIEEHGLHIWLGYYDNAFRLVRECYGELDRPRRAPGCAIRTWRDAFERSSLIGLEDHYEASWSTWVADFGCNDLLPGEPADVTRPMTVAELARRSMRLLADFYASLEWGADARSVTGSAALATLMTAGLQALRVVEHELARVRTLAGPVTDLAIEPLERLRAAVLPLVEADPARRRLFTLVDLVTSQLRGILADGLLGDPRAFRAIDDIEYRDWLAAHGAARTTLESPLVRGIYSLVFGHRDGDAARAQFPAGLGLFLASKLFFDYKGALFWKMQAGMGDVVFAPIYEALRARGVEFEFFHRVEQLHLSRDRSEIERVSIARQVALSEDRSHYEPLIDVAGLPCFPGTPDLSQLDVDAEVLDHDLESFWCTWPDAERRELTKGADYDALVFAIPVGMAAHVCRELIADRQEWREMVDNVGTVATQVLQIWLRGGERELGFQYPGVTVTGFVDSYDTMSSMSHLLARETWPVGDEPGTIAYFCGTMPREQPADPTDPGQLERAREHARREAVAYLSHHVGHYFPGCVDPETGEFRWDLLCGAEGRPGAAALDSQLCVANVDPSDLYVQALPGTDRYRLRPDRSGYRDLYLAGDWTDCGLNAGCIEAAVLSGLQAANAILGLPRSHDITGGYLM
jgi:uncharacterized protein with NAD-binding domain and iron-sulfur cluster